MIKEKPMTELTTQAFRRLRPSDAINNSSVEGSFQFARDPL
jgi:hypothetical protein